MSNESAAQHFDRSQRAATEHLLRNRFGLLVTHSMGLGTLDIMARAAGEHFDYSGVPRPTILVVDHHHSAWLWRKALIGHGVPGALVTHISPEKVSRGNVDWTPHLTTPHLWLVNFDSLHSARQVETFARPLAQAQQVMARVSPPNNLIHAPAMRPWTLASSEMWRRHLDTGEVAYRMTARSMLGLPT